MTRLGELKKIISIHLNPGQTTLGFSKRRFKNQDLGKNQSTKNKHKYNKQQKPFAKQKLF